MVNFGASKLGARGGPRPPGPRAPPPGSASAQIRHTPDTPSPDGTSPLTPDQTPYMVNRW